MASKNMDSTIYIHKMPFRERQDLVDILNSGDTWRTLGGYYMNYDTVQLDKFALQVHKPGGSPADAMLSFWGQRNHTVLKLWKLLKQMKHFQAMESIKSLVPESIWWEMNPQNTNVKTLESNAYVAMRVPPPPPTINQGIIKYAQFFPVFLLNFPLLFFSGGSPVSIKWLSTVHYGNFRFSFII